MKTQQTNLENQVKTMQTSIESNLDTKIQDIKDKQIQLESTTNAIQTEQIQIKSMLVEILNAIKK